MVIFSKSTQMPCSDLFGIKVRKMVTLHLSNVNFNRYRTVRISVFKLSDWLWSGWRLKREGRDEGKFLLNSFSFYLTELSLCLELQAVKNYMRTECKCHGLSGSCTLRTCWKKMPHFREVGDRLLERFNGASKVMGGNDGKTLIPVGQNIKPPDKQDLIYSAESPDFCLPNRKTGSLGTRGRMCNSTALDVSGCDLLCCGRGYWDETVVLEENCLCRFHWCCVVQCKKCLVRKELSLCH